MATSLTFLPAMLGFLGPRVLSRRERAALADRTARRARKRAGFWLRWARFVEARKVLVALGSLAAVVAIALPIFGLRLGTSDASTDPAGSTTHQAYTALAQGFGPGFNGPLELAAQAGSPRRRHRLRPSPGRRRPHARGGVGDARGDLAEREGAAGHPLPDHQPAGQQTVNLVNDLRDQPHPPGRPAAPAWSSTSAG